MEEQRKSENALVPALRFEGFSDPWEQRKFLELVERRSRFSNDPALPRIEYEDIVSGQGMLNKDVIEKHDKRGGIAFEPGDVLYGKLRPYLQNWLNPQFKGIALGDFWVLNPTDISSGFLFVLIRTPTFERVANESTGTKTPRADWQNVSNTEFSIPLRKEEQEAIGALFQKLDSLIALHQRKHEKLKTVKQSLLEKMFPKEGEDVPEIRFEGFTDPWEQRTFDEFVYASGSRNADNLDLESHSVSNTSGFVPQSEQFENGGTMAEADKTAYWIVEPGSFAYNPARINVGSIGYLATRENVIVSSLYEVFRSDETCDDRFLWHWLKSALFAKQIEALQEGGVRLYFFFDKLLKSEITMPSIREQSIIGSLFDRLDSLIALHQRERAGV
ncbi:MAG: restriction endonuclease subunit S [Adlercreutzia sp.]